MVINVKEKSSFVFTKFWLVFILLNIFGLTYNYVFLSQTSGTLESMIFDLLAYFFILMICFSLETLIYNYKDIDIEGILKKVFIYSSIIFILLFIVSRYTDNIFGMPLFHYWYFSPLATNLHHTAMYIAILPFIGLMYITKVNKVNKLVYLFFVISNIYLGLQTGSSKAILGFIVGGIVFIVLGIFSRIKGQRKKIIASMFLVIFFALIIAIKFSAISTYIVRLFVETDSNGVRQVIYKFGFEKSLKSIIIGYGPGAHSEIGGRYIDTHQTLLTILIQSGIFGLLYFLKFNVNLVLKYSKNTLIMGAVCPIIMYALGGDIMRRLPIWIFLVLFYYFIVNKSVGLNKSIQREININE